MVIPVLDLFSAAAGGWSLGMHRAGFKTVAACEAVAWRRALYSENNPGVPVYDDVCTLTADRLVRDLGYFPSIVVGSPPCQDISSANTKGKGVEGERSKLFFEAIRIIGEGRPRWFALENSANLRTRGADAVLAALEALGYSCWAVVVRARDVGANHERPRSWIIGCDLGRLTDACETKWRASSHSRGDRDRQAGEWPESADRRSKFVPACAGNSTAATPRHATEDGRGPGRAWGRPIAASGIPLETCGHAAETPPNADQAGQAGQADGCLVSGLRQAQIANDGRGDVGRSDVPHADREGEPDGAEHAEVGRGTSAGGSTPEPWADWNGGLAAHLQLDDGLSAWLAGTRIAVGGPRGTSAASLIVEAFGDAVVPQIPEAIGRAILRVEEALAAVSERIAA